ISFYEQGHDIYIIPCPCFFFNKYPQLALRSSHSSKCSQVCRSMSCSKASCMVLSPENSRITINFTFLLCLFSCFWVFSIGYLHRSEKPGKGHRQRSPATDSEKPVTYRLASVSYFSNFLVKSRCFRCQRTDTHQKALLNGHLSCLYSHFYGNKVSNQPTTNRATSPVNQAIHSFGSSC